MKFEKGDKVLVEVNVENNADEDGYLELGIPCETDDNTGAFRIHESVYCYESNALALPKPQWIDVHDRLPERKEYYLVTDRAKDVFVCEYEDGKFDTMSTVIAWQERPTPYEPPVKLLNFCHECEDYSEFAGTSTCFRHRKQGTIPLVPFIHKSGKPCHEV